MPVHLAHAAAPSDPPSPRRPLPPAFAAEGPVALSALQQAEALRRGELSARELVEATLARIAAHDGALGAFAEVQAASARRQADAADALRRSGAALGPFHGVPTAVKDHHLTRGGRTQMGSRAFWWLHSPVDDRTVRRLRRAGFVVLGKTTMSELGLLPVTETAVYPPTRNPWDLGRSAGGSSGGAGAAVAAGLVAVAPGSDGAGSVRIPAALNGLYGLKPTRGVVHDDASRIDPFQLTVIGPLARDLDDCAALLDVLAERPGMPYLRASRQRPPRLRVGVVREAAFGAVDPALVAAVDAAAERLRAAGHALSERPPPDASVDAFTPLYQHFVARIPVLTPWRLEPLVRWFWQEGRHVPRAQAMAIFNSFAELGRAMMDDLDVLLTPTVPSLPPAIGAYDHLPPQDMFRALAPLGGFTALANVTGQPAISVPFGLSGDLPLGVQLIGRHDQDAALLALARELSGA